MSLHSNVKLNSYKGNVHANFNGGRVSKEYTSQKERIHKKKFGEGPVPKQSHMRHRNYIESIKKL